MTFERLNAARRQKRATGKISPEFADVIDFVAKVENDYLRRVLKKRFLDARSWAFCAIYFGTTEDSLRKYVTRLIKKQEEKP